MIIIGPSGIVLVADDLAGPFGTGEHESTRGCLLALAALGPFTDVLDFGTGSGILAIVAAKLWPGAAVRAVDTDTAVAVTNAAGNGEPAIVFGNRMGNGSHDLVVANVETPDIAALKARVAIGGTLVLAGGPFDTGLRRDRLIAVRDYVTEVFAWSP